MAILTFRTTKPHPVDGQMSLMDHIAELRTRILRTFYALAIGAVIAWFLYQPILHFMIGPIRASAPKGAFSSQKELITLSPLEPLTVRIKLTSYGALILAMPVILWQLWRFIAPGLYSNEKKYAVWFVTAGTALFGMGAAIAFWTLPRALGWLRTIGGHSFTQFYSPDKYLQLVVYMMISFGIGFEFPIVLVALLMTGVVTTTQLRRARRYAIVIIAIVVAVATPSSDPFSMMALCIPMWFFYEIAIVFGRIRDHRRSKRPAVV